MKNEYDIREDMDTVIENESIIKKLITGNHDMLNELIKEDAHMYGNGYNGRFSRAVNTMLRAECTAIIELAGLEDDKEEDILYIIEDLRSPVEEIEEQVIEYLHMQLL